MPGRSTMLSSLGWFSSVVFLGRVYTTGLCSTPGLPATRFSVMTSRVKALASISVGRCESEYVPVRCCGAQPSELTIGLPSERLYLLACDAKLQMSLACRLNASAWANRICVVRMFR